MILVDINSKLLKKVFKIIIPRFICCRCIQESNFRSLINYALKNIIIVDIIVNNAECNTQKPKFMEIVSEKEFDKVFNVNAKSVY